MRLIYKASGDDVKIGDPVSLNDVTMVISRIEEPRHAASSGRVILTFGDNKHEFFPSVIGAEWIERDDAA